MSQSKFVYVTYIRTTPEKLWQALTEPEFTRKFWCECWQECDWQVGSEWKLMIPDGRVGDSGKILEIVPHEKLVLSWKNEFKPEMAAEGYSTLTYEIEALESSVMLTVTHEIDVPESKLVDAVSQGWPHLFASLKSLLETGEPLVETTKWPEGM